MLLQEVASGKGPDGKDIAQVDDLSADQDVSIVAVHGLNPFNAKNHHLHTWSKPAEDNGRLWLRDELPKCAPGARVMIYKYNSNPAFSASKEKFVHQANDLLERLWGKRREDHNRPLIFIAHSLGGILVKQALLNAYNNPRFQEIRSATSGLIFFGTPHTGGNEWLLRLGEASTRIVRGVFGHMHPPNDLLEALKKGSPYTDMLQENWRHQLEQFKIVSFYETESNIVSRDSAAIGLSGDRENIVAINADHSNICRFDLTNAEDESNYEVVAANVQELYEYAMDRREQSVLNLPEVPSTKPVGEGPTESSAEASGEVGPRRLGHPQENNGSNHKKPEYGSVEAENSHASQLLQLVKIVEAQAPELKKVLYMSYIQSFQHYQYNHAFDSYLSSRLKGTCEWLFGEDPSQGWVAPSVSMSMWIHGPTGCGKSVLAAYTTERLRKETIELEGKCTVLYSFWEEHRNDTVSSILSMLIHQFLILHPTLHAFAFEKDGRRHDGGLGQQIRRGRDRSVPDLLSLLFRLVQESDESHVVLVLDGIDKYESVSLEALLGGILEAGSRFRVFLFGRPVQSTPKFFSTALGARSVLLQEVDLTVHTNGLATDLDLFTAEAIRQLSKQRSLVMREKDKILAHLRGNYSATFLSLRIIVQQLKMRTLFDLDTTLTSLPVDLEELYRSLFRIVRDASAPETPRILEYLLFARRTLALEEVHYAWSATSKNKDGSRSISEQQLRAYFQQLEPMVILDHEDQVKCIHSSAKEFLEAKMKILPPTDPFKLDPRQCHQDIAIACLQRLASATSVGFPARHKHGYDNLLRERLNENRLLEYALRHWLPHLREATAQTDDPRDIDLDLIHAVLRFALLWKNSVGSELLRLIVLYGRLQSLDYRKAYSSFELFSALGLVCLVRALTNPECTILPRYSLVGYVDSALSLAISGGHAEVVTLIMERWDVTSMEGPVFAGTLEWAARNGDSDMVKKLLNIRKRDPAEVSRATNVALSSRDVETLKVLVESRAFEDRDEWGNTVLHALFVFDQGQDLATRPGEVDRVCTQIQLYVESDGVDISAREGNFGNTALHLACWYRYPRPVIQQLINLGSDSTTRNTFGWTALHLASRYSCNVDTVKLLLDLERPNAIGSTTTSDLNPAVAKRSRGDMTPLHFASQRWGRYQEYDDAVGVVSLLLREGADPHFPNRRGETPLQYARHTSWGPAVFQRVYTRFDVIDVPQTRFLPPVGHPQRVGSDLHDEWPVDMESGAVLRGIEIRSDSWELSTTEEHEGGESSTARERSARNGTQRDILEPERNDVEEEHGFEDRRLLDADRMRIGTAMLPNRQNSISSIESVRRDWPPPGQYEARRYRRVTGFKQRFRKLFDRN